MKSVFVPLLLSVSQPLLVAAGPTIGVGASHSYGTGNSTSACGSGSTGCIASTGYLASTGYTRASLTPSAPYATHNTTNHAGTGSGSISAYSTGASRASLGTTTTKPSLTKPSSTSRGSSITSSSPASSSSSSQTSSSASSTTSVPPLPWNLNNITCAELSYLNTSQQWAHVDGDSAVDTFQQMFSGNKLICSECFGEDKGACTSTDPKCQNGLADLGTLAGSKTPRWDTAVAHFAQDADENDLECQIGTSECSGAPSCGDADGPGAFLMLKSLETMHNSLQNIYNAIGQAGSQATDQMTQFSSVFAPVPSIKGEAIFLEILTAIIGGIMGLAAGPAGAIAGTMLAIGSGVVMENLFFDGPAPADTSTILGVIVNQTQNSYSAIADTLFATGNYQFTSANGKASTSITMANLMKNGALLEQDNNPTDTYTALVPEFEKILFQQLALYTWENLEVDKVAHIPFIAFDPEPCGKVDPTNPKSLAAVIQGVNGLDANYESNGTCYYLLDGRPWARTIPSARYSYTVVSCTGHALPGGTNKDMSDNGDIFGHLGLQDFIVPAVLGWTQNGKKNGYPAASANGQLVSNADDAAAVSIPICDYRGNPDSPGVGCPKINGLVHGSSCDVY